MNTAVPYLSPASIAKLEALLATARTTAKNATGRDGYSESVMPHQAPEVYIAYPVSADGIPGMTGIEPGHGECYIYQLVQVGTSNDYDKELMLVDGLTKEVYNLAASPIPQMEFPILRDKYGNWLAAIAGMTLLDGLVVACQGDGWYQVELAEFDPTPPVVFGTGTGTSSGVGDDCTPCNMVETDVSNCTAPQEVAITRTLPVGTGTIVRAHYTRTLPLKVGGHVRLTRMAAPAVVGTGSGTAVGTGTSATDNYYSIVTGQHTLWKLPFPDYECCTDPVTAATSVQLVACSHVIVEGHGCGSAYTPCAGT